MQKLRFVLLDVIPPNITKLEADKNLQELISLVDTFGGATIVRVIQRRDRPDSSTFIGSGKAEELVQIVKDEKIDGVVLNGIVKPGQIFNLEKMIWPVNHLIRVWDRVDLILNIFDKHAHTAEAKLQIELARMRHMGPRMFGLGGNELSRQGGGIGTRGAGETNTEQMKRHWRDEMKNVETKLLKLRKDRERQLNHRREIGYKTVSIVGYTNAGKSTLFNTLTGKKKLAENVLFATLDSSVGKIYLPSVQKEILTSDTIGFIQNLPAKLVEAFRSTLMESINADLLLHVIDASDAKMQEKISVVEDTLEDLKIQDKPRIYVFNKIDVDPNWNREDIFKFYGQYSPQFISAKTGDGIDTLKKEIGTILI
jgi:GTP-binding protein HflX